MVSLYTLCIMILAIGGVGIIMVLPYAWAADINCHSGTKCYGTAANDVMKGANGYDQMHGFGGNDEMRGGDGNDWMVGYAGDDWIWGGNGFDQIRGSQGNDHLFGEAGNDKIYGEDGNDQIIGYSGADQLIGGKGADTIWGTDGNDVIWHGLALDTLDNARSDGSKDTIYCNEGYDKVIYNSRDGDVVSNCEEKFDYKPPRPAGNEDCDRRGMPGCP